MCAGAGMIGATTIRVRSCWSLIRELKVDHVGTNKWRLTVVTGFVRRSNLELRGRGVRSAQLIMMLKYAARLHNTTEQVVPLTWARLASHIVAMLIPNQASLLLLHICFWWWAWCLKACKQHRSICTYFYSSTKSKAGGGWSSASNLWYGTKTRVKCDVLSLSGVSSAKSILSIAKNTTLSYKVIWYEVIVIFPDIF